ncbi:MAG TPA: RDD family protein [Blastocatellia bacterium]|nr:RDD family protein [Blastocatellia bacterium]
MRAIRANRGAASSTPDQHTVEVANPVDSEVRYAIPGIRLDEGRTAYDRVPGVGVTPPRPESSQQAAPGRRSSNNIVEAALTRVKRASENASRASLPKIEPARSIQTTTQGSLAVDRQATARALVDPLPDIEPSVQFTPAPRPEIIQPPVIVQSSVIVQPPVIAQPSVLKSEPLEAAAAEPSVSATQYDTDKRESSPVIILEEIEPLDYLEAEVRKVDKALGAEFLRNESPSIVIHSVIGIVDLIAIAVSCSPFLAIVMIADGALAIGQTRLATGGIIALIAFFYLVLTQCLCGRTFGMMLTNTRVVDSQTFEPPSPSQALLRTIGCFIAAAPALVGFLWAAFDYKHRGWQDFISRTLVVRDF